MNGLAVSNTTCTVWLQMLVQISSVATKWGPHLNGLLTTYFPKSPASTSRHTILVVPNEAIKFSCMGDANQKVNASGTKGRHSCWPTQKSLTRTAGCYSIIWLGGRVSPCNNEGNGPVFTYADADINTLPEQLQILWEPPQAVSFGSEVSYLDSRDPFLYNNSYTRCQPLLLAGPTS